MTDTAMTTAVATPAEPDGAPRLPVLDVLRGIAILGILFMNINDMGGAIAIAGGADERQLGWGTLDQIAWSLREVFANGTARCMLEMLFGVGMVILTERAATRIGKWRVLGAYAWRNIVLFLFGLVHVFILLWPGDILHTYGLAALVAVLFRRWRPRWLLVAGLSMAMIQLVAGGFLVAQVKQLQAHAAAAEARRVEGKTLTAAERKDVAAWNKRLADKAKGRADAQAMVDRENRDRTGAPRQWVGSAWGSFIYIETMLLEPLFIWEAAGTMLIGAALFRLGFIAGGWRRRSYVVTTVTAYAIGLTCRAGLGAVVASGGHGPSWFFPFGELARVATTVGHIGVVNLLLMNPAGARLLRPFDAAGKTALSIYIAQTLICLWVLYPPWGLALYGHQGWAALMLTALAVNAALLWGANIWVRHFTIAPVEWAWRSLIARRRLPFRARASSAGGALPAMA